MSDDSQAGQEHDDLDQIKCGGESVLAEMYQLYGPQLERIVEFRIDRRLVGRIEAADILQEAYLEISRRLADYLQDPKVSLFIWVRQIVWQTLLMNHRRHLGAQKRSVGQELPLQFGDPNQTSVSLASKLIGSVTSPSHAAMRDERVEQLRHAIDTMDAMDREVLALRHFEQLNNKQVAEALGIGKTAASNRYVRALERLREILDQMNDDL